MDYLKTLALPQSMEHFHLLLLILTLGFVVFLPYTGFLAGTAGLSVFFRRRGMRRTDPLALRFSRDLAALALAHHALPLYLSVLPALSLVFVYAQLLQGTPAITVGLAGFGFLLLAAGVLWLLRYRSAYRITEAIGVPHHGEAHGDESAALVEETVARQEKDGRRGVVALVTGYLLVTWAGVVAADPAHWAEIDTVFALFLAPDAWLKVFHTAALAAGATGVGMLFFFFAWEGGGKVREREYAELIRRTAYRLTAVAFLAQPVLLVGYLALLPDASLTGALFALAGGAILLILLAAQFVYAFARDPRPGYAAYAFYTLGLAFVLLVVADQTAIGTATRGNATRLAGVHARTTADLKAQLGVGAPAVTGEDIYNGRCSACHLFDAKKVGPPYRETMPKYQGKKDALIAFILNPVKVNPAYPPMPNQGLKPAEAESIATYLLRRTAAVPPPPQSVQGK